MAGTLKFTSGGSGLLDYSDLIKSIDAPVVIDHLGRIDLSEGLTSPSVRRLLELLDTGTVWVKVSGLERISRVSAPYSDAVGLAALVVSHAPERVLWGTDFPHVNISGAAPDDGLLTDLLMDIAPSAELLEKILVTNPAAFFDFPNDDRPAGTHL